MRVVSMVQGVGTNNRKHPMRITVDGVKKIDKSYNTWSTMLKRCYDKKFHIKQPTYIGCRVCGTWLEYSNFKEWFDVNYVDNWVLDKDLLVGGNKLYSPDTCVFLPRSLNAALTISDKSRGDHPLGVSFHKRVRKYSSSCSASNKSTHHGYFDNANEAHRSWQLAKISVLLGWVDQYVDNRILTGLNRIISNIEEDYRNNRETLDLS